MNAPEGALAEPPVREDDGLEHVEDPNSEEATGIPGGRQPGDDGYVPPDGEQEPAGEDPDGPDPEAAGDGEGGEQPPTPPADLGKSEAEEEDEDAQPALFLPADRELGLKVGGRKPDTSILKLKGTKIDLGTGQFDRGDRISMVAVCQITGDNDQDTIDTQNGEVKSTAKAQSATVCGTELLAEFLRRKIASTDLYHEVCAELEVEPVEEGK